uniref:Sugar phosphate transporter domain-containing protein n=1 Tax=Arcella intermedia TaxID=1963864 RepID=A0A6B2LBE2_9EUKA
MFILWVLFTSTAALYSKSFLKSTPLPFTLTAAQGFIGMVGNYWLLMLSEGSVSLVQGNPFDICIVLGAHIMGTAMTNEATVSVEASFVNTLKAAEPLCAVFLSKYVLQQEMTFLTYGSLITIVIGVALACTTEFHFQWNGFLNTMGSNLCFTSRATYTKKLINKDKTLSSQSIFWCISTFTFICAFFPMLYEIHSKDLLHKLLQPDPIHSLIKAIISHYMYNILSFYLVVELDALSYSVGNSVKRLITIYCSVLYFKNPVSLLNLISSFVAVFGVFIYSYDRDQVKKREMKKLVL